jgi:hypothetical protein
MKSNRYESERGSEVNIGRCSLDPAVGQYRKRAPKKKPWVIRWEWTGDRTGMNKLQRMLCESSRQRYATEKQARQALADWQRGRGIYGQVFTPDKGWVAHIISPNAKMTDGQNNQKS